MRPIGISETYRPEWDQLVERFDGDTHRAIECAVNALLRGLHDGTLEFAEAAQAVAQPGGPDAT